MTTLTETDTLDPVRDPARLAAVRATGLLDSAVEESFDRLTRLAAKLTGAPVTFISLVAEERDFYKSCFGFPEPLASERQLTGTTFCHYALVSRGPLVIEDTLANPIYRDVPTVQSLGVRAYLGIPLKLNGVAIGKGTEFAIRL
jgi:GAF domain-containing protein